MDNTTSWRPLFDAAVSARGAVVVARELGYNNHTLVSRIAKGHITASDKFIARVLVAYHVVACPHTGKQQARSQCSTWLGVAAPTHHPGSLSHWRACQRCPHKPEPGDTP